MNSLKSLYVALLFAGFSISPVTAQESNSYFLHTIEKGQSLYSIASTYNVSTVDIIKLNPGCNDKLHAGQSLRIPQSKTKKQSQLFHTIQDGETLYGLTMKYKVSAEDICDANPGLSSDNFKIGQVIVIPTSSIAEQNAKSSATQSTIRPAVKSRCQEMHQVKKKETIFSISQKYNIAQEELIAANPELKSGIKKGSLICIPYPTPKVEIKEIPNDRELFNARKIKDEKLSTVKAAIILPFMLNGGKKTESARMVEFYEGFLLAVDSLKRTGTSVDLYTYDSGSTSLSINSILEKEELKKMNVIFGPLYNEQIKPVASFAKKNNIKLVIPFSSKDNQVFNNPSIFQINTPQSYLYSEVYEHFLRKFTSANVIFLDADDSDGEKKEFINGFQQELRNQNIRYKVVKATTDASALAAALNPAKENIFIPTSGSNITLIKCLPQLQFVAKANPNTVIHLFGYPEWQTYTNDHLTAFYELDTYFYTSFYTNNLLPEAVKFISSYRKWYSKDMINTYPKFGMLGFDMGYFFLNALSKYGTGFEKQLTHMNSARPIQTGFKFERANNWGGFINKKVFFVNFSKKYELIKFDFE
ncbi:LysM peptidoglycan-binding domain-containing protein [uncultured Bacteroides sp.]|uniref:LysM peptidoglycan-binding domain-containing protein n=1 Tax=uncultured Bacteroides sp. TaxID=162156 RepID=UPI002AAB3252|nr:LysM peptidoglycan-binding domain-containing protein [uncultured Bacteroides sp.]